MTPAGVVTYIIKCSKTIFCLGALGSGEERSGALSMSSLGHSLEMTLLS